MLLRGGGRRIWWPHRRGDARTAGQPDSRTAGQPDSRTAGQPDSRTAGQPDSRTAGQPDSRTAGDWITAFATYVDARPSSEILPARIFYYPYLLREIGRA